MARLNTQAAVRKAVAAAVPDVMVRTSVPADRPAELVVVQRSGGAMQDPLIDAVGISVDVWAPTEAKAYALMEKVSEAINGLVFADGFALVNEESMRSDYDVLAGSPRWFASYTIRTYPKE
jgi:hypothetical protein